MSYRGPTDLPALSELCRMRQPHLCPLGAGTRRALLLAQCLQPSLAGGTAVLARESPADTRLVGIGSCGASTSFGFKANLVKAVQTLPQSAPPPPPQRQVY